MQDIIITPSDFVSALNQTLEFAYPTVQIEGELANYKVSKGKWVYFDLKDEYASVKFFGTVYNLPGPLEDGMMLRVIGQPQMNPRYGFSITCRQITPVGEGSLIKAAQLLQAKLEREGLFAEDRKRVLPYPPTRIGLITSGQSAAYADFIKIINSRWGGVRIDHLDVQVQGDQAVTDIMKAFDVFNTSAHPPDVVVLTRGGGSADDLAAFNTEQVTRAVAGSRSPTLVAIGHEIDICLAELAADRRASTPSNAAELLVPDRTAELEALVQYKQYMSSHLLAVLTHSKQEIIQYKTDLQAEMKQLIKHSQAELKASATLLDQLNPDTVLKRGYVLVRDKATSITSIGQVKPNQHLQIQFKDGTIDIIVKNVNEVR